MAFPVIWVIPGIPYEYLLSLLFFSVGVVFAFVSNEKVNDSLRDFEDTVNTAINNSLDFIEDTQRV